MIFVSHNIKDKSVVEPLALKLAEIFGKEKVFYDSWSIQPGDSLVGKMDEGLQSCKFFLLFVSGNSLKSEMVKLEWRSALIKRTKGEVKIIPIILEQVDLPPTLTDTVFINTASQTQETTLRQIVDVIEGKNTYKDDIVSTGFHNILAFWKNIENGLEIEFQAQQYMEPISRYVIITENIKDDLEYSCPEEGMFNSGFQDNFKLNDGRIFNVILIGVDRPTVPGFPLKVVVKIKSEKELKIIGVMRAVAKSSFRGLPLIVR